MFDFTQDFLERRDLWGGRWLITSIPLFFDEFASYVAEDGLERPYWERLDASAVERQIMRILVESLLASNPF